MWHLVTINNSHFHQLAYFMKCIQKFKIKLSLLFSVGGNYRRRLYGGVWYSANRQQTYTGNS